MFTERQDWAHSTGSQFTTSFKQFLQGIKTLRPNSKGQYIIRSLKYDPLLVDRQNQKNLISRLISKPHETGCRHYLLYVPQKKAQKMPLIILLHGTGSNLLTTELIFIKGKQTRWMDLADQQGFALAIPQSRTVTFAGKKNIIWQPGDQDLFYIIQVIRDVIKYFGKQGKGEIDNRNINFVGKSNGGLFISDLYLSYILKKNQNLIKTLQFRINLFCNYMGGLQREQLQFDKYQFDEKRKKTLMLVMTCKGEDNFELCLRADWFFSYHNCNTKLIKVNHDRHEFLPQSVNQIYKMIMEEYQTYKHEND